MNQKRKQRSPLIIHVDQRGMVARCDRRCFSTTVDTTLDEQVEELKAWCTGYFFSEVTVYLDASCLMTCEFELPPGAEKIQETAICFQAESYLPVSIDDNAALCFRVRADPHVLFVTVSKALVTAFRTLSDRVVILPGTLAMVSVAVKQRGKDEQWFQVTTDTACEYVLWADGQPKRWLCDGPENTEAAAVFQKLEGIAGTQKLQSLGRDPSEWPARGSLSGGVRKSLNFCDGIGVTAIDDTYEEQRLVRYCQSLFVFCLIAFIALMLRRNHLDVVQTQIVEHRQKVVKTVFPDSRRKITNRRIRSELQKQQSHERLAAEWQGQERRSFASLGDVLQVLAGQRDLSIVSGKSDSDGVEIQLDVVTRPQLDSISGTFREAGFSTEVLDSAPVNGLTRAVLRVSKEQSAQ